MAPKPLAKLFNLQVSLTTDGNILVNYEGPPNPDDLERAFDEWNDEYENTHKIVSLTRYLKDYSENQIKDIYKILG
tara:strand:- start:197 stop:424 length:228 start_codon:yes stop_codon:yes gene_type:complete